MHPMRQIELIRSTLPDGGEGAAEIRAAARVLERSVSAGEILGAVADPEFPSALLATARECASDERQAWLTLGAAGARRARQVLAWRASELLDTDELAAVAMSRGRRRRFTRRAASASGPDAAAWALLAHLDRDELRALVRARPALAAAERRRRRSRGHSGARALHPALG